MSLCPEAVARAAMTDEEFWAHVFPQPEHEYGPDPDDEPSRTIGPCLRCGQAIVVEEYEEAVLLLEARVDFCAECADEMIEEEECESSDGPLS